MKKLLLCAIIVFPFLLTGCGDKLPVSDGSDSVKANVCFTNAPDWVISGGAEDGFTSVGAAKVGKAGTNVARSAAIANARQEMAFSISVKVNAMFKDFVQTTGIGDEETVDKMTTSVTKQITSQTLEGTRQRAIWMSPCDEIYVLIEANSDVIKKAVKNQSLSSLSNDKAIWQQIQAQKAQDELDAAIAKEFPAE